jgi:hypothetical protein
MSCCNHANSSFAVLPTQCSGQRDHSPWRRMIVAFIEAFYEALELRRAAYRRYHLPNE